MKKCYNIINAWQTEGIVTGINESNKNFLDQALRIMLSPEWQPKQNNIHVLTCVAALSVLRDLGFDVKYTGKYKKLYDYFNFNIVVEGDKIKQIGEK